MEIDAHDLPAASVGNDLAPRLRPGRLCALSFFTLFHLFIPGLLVGTSKQEVIEKIRHEACGRRRRQRIEALRTVKHGITPAKLGKRNPRLIPGLGNDGSCRHHRLDGDENVVDVDDAVAAPRAHHVDACIGKPRNDAGILDCIEFRQVRKRHGLARLHLATDVFRLGEPRLIGLLKALDIKPGLRERVQRSLMPAQEGKEKKRNPVIAGFLRAEERGSDDLLHGVLKTIFRHKQLRTVRGKGRRPRRARQCR